MDYKAILVQLDDTPGATGLVAFAAREANAQGADARAAVSRHHPRGEVGNALLVLADDRKIDLLVMGGYGHARYREILPGRVSRTVLRRLAVPVLLAH